MAIAKQYRPVVRAGSEDGVYHGAALTGGNSVILGWSMDENAPRNDLMGFAIRRTQFDPDTKEILEINWPNGQKRFRGLQEGVGFDVRSDQAPFQRFRWAPTIRSIIPPPTATSSGRCGANRETCIATIRLS